MDGQQTTSPSQLVGVVLPEVVLRDDSGESRVLPLRGAERAMLVFVLTSEDCLSCGDFALEAKIIQRRLPGLEAVLVGVGSGADSLTLKQYFTANRASYLLDLDNTIRIQWRLAHTPTAILLSREGRVLWVDGRSGGAARSAPVSQVLWELSREISTPRGATSPTIPKP